MGHEDVVRDLSFAPNGSLILVSASRDKTLRVWDLSRDGRSMQGFPVIDHPWLRLGFGIEGEKPMSAGEMVGKDLW